MLPRCGHRGQGQVQHRSLASSCARSLKLCQEAHASACAFTGEAMRFQQVECNRLRRIPAQDPPIGESRLRPPGSSRRLSRRRCQRRLLQRLGGHPVFVLDEPFSVSEPGASSRGPRPEVGWPGQTE